MKLTATQIAAKINKTGYTIKRWYNWYNSLSDEKKQSYIEQGMPELPEYDTVGSTNWRYWDEEDIPKLLAFSNWVPHTKNGVFKD